MFLTTKTPIDAKPIIKAIKDKLSIPAWRSLCASELSPNLSCRAIKFILMREQIIEYKNEINATTINPFHSGVLKSFSKRTSISSKEPVLSVVRCLNNSKRSFKLSRKSVFSFSFSFTDIYFRFGLRFLRG